MTGLIERLVPDELWTLFRRVVPPTEVIRPQGGGRRRAGDRECLAAIIFVATSGCTWRQLPPVFGPAWPTVYRRFAQWSRDRVWARLHRVVLDELGARGELDWSRCAIDSVSLRAAKGGPDRTESDRPRQERIENPPDHGPERSAPVVGHLRRQPARQPWPEATGTRDTADPLPARPASPATGQAPRRQGIRLRPPAPMPPQAGHPSSHRPQRHRVLAAAGPPPLGRRADSVWPAGGRSRWWPACGRGR